MLTDNQHRINLGDPATIRTVDFHRIIPTIRLLIILAKVLNLILVISVIGLFRSQAFRSS